jgi:hypothetical protein
VLALTNVMPPFKLKEFARRLQESHMGTTFSPVTCELMMWPPSVAPLEHPLTEQVAGHDLPDQRLPNNSTLLTGQRSLFSKDNDRLPLEDRSRKRGNGALTIG